MPVEPNLRDLFGDDGSPLPGKLDARTIIRRSKRRRLPKQIGVGGASAVAAVGIFTGAGFGLSALGGSSSAGSSIASLADGAQDSGRSPAPEKSDGTVVPGVKRPAAEGINTCGGALETPAPSATGLRLTVDFPDAAAGASSVNGTVTLTNTGPDAIRGDAYARPTVILSRDGVVIWHSHDLVIRDPLPVSLDPGQSVSFDASFAPVVCTSDSDLAPDRDGQLPAAHRGEYQVSAIMDVTVSSNAELVTGPLSTVKLN
jgi:hypothetical protein